MSLPQYDPNNNDWRCDTEQDSMVMWQIEQMALRKWSQALKVRKEFSIPFSPEGYAYLDLTYQDRLVFFKYLYSTHMYDYDFMRHYAIYLEYFIPAIPEFKQRIAAPNSKFSSGSQSLLFFHDLVPKP